MKKMPIFLLAGVIVLGLSSYTGFAYLDQADLHPAALSSTATTSSATDAPEQQNRAAMLADTQAVNQAQVAQADQAAEDALIAHTTPKAETTPVLGDAATYATAAYLLTHPGKAPVETLKAQGDFSLTPTESVKNQGQGYLATIASDAQQEAQISVQANHVNVQAQAWTTVIAKDDLDQRYGEQAKVITALAEASLAQGDDVAVEEPVTT